VPLTLPPPSGVWRVEWEHCYEELTDPPIPTPKGLRVNVRQEKKRVLGMFGGGSNSKEVWTDRTLPQVQVRYTLSTYVLDVVYWI